MISLPEEAVRYAASHDTERIMRRAEEENWTMSQLHLILEAKRIMVLEDIADELKIRRS